MQRIATDRATLSDSFHQRSPGDQGYLSGLWEAPFEGKGVGELSVKLPRKTTKVFMEGPVGFEPTTPGLKVVRIWC